MTIGFKNPILLVSGLFIRDNKVLLGLRKNTRDYPNHWSVPIGHVEAGESENEAFIREMQEELNIAVTQFSPYDKLIDEQASISNQVYWVTRWRGEIVNAEPIQCKALQWFKIDALPSPLTPVTKTLLSKGLNGKID